MHDLVERYALCREIRQGSIDQLHYAVESLEKFLGRTLELSDLTDRTVNRFILWLANEGFAVDTIRSRRRAILTIWKSAAEDGLCEMPRKIRGVSPAVSVPRAWTAEQIAAIVSQCDRLRGCFRSSPSVSRGLFAKAFCLTAYETGFRRSDLLRIRRPQIQDSGLIVLVQSKTGRPHLARIRLATLAMIDAMGTAGRSHVFGDVVSVRRLSRMLGCIFKAAGIDEGSLKWLRRSGATHVEMEHPGAGWKFLGHTTPRVAEQSYLDPLQIGQEPLIPPELE